MQVKKDNANLSCALVEKKWSSSSGSRFSYRKKAARPRRPTKLAPEAAILGAAPSKGVTGPDPGAPVPVGAAVPAGTSAVVGPAGVVEFT